MSLAIVPFALLLTAGGLFAQEPFAESRWVSLLAGHELQLSIDTTTAKDAGKGSYEVWARWQWASDQPRKDGRPSFRYTISREEINCTSGELRQLRAYYYDTKSHVVSSDLYGDALDTPIPDSYGEALVRSGCRVLSGAYKREVLAWVAQFLAADSLRAAACERSFGSTILRLCRASRGFGREASNAGRELDRIFNLPKVPAAPTP